jgi:hypothetical protein
VRSSLEPVLQSRLEYRRGPNYLLALACLVVDFLRKRQVAEAPYTPLTWHFGAEDGIRTRDPNLGKVVRYRCATSAWTNNSSLPALGGKTIGAATLSNLGLRVTVEFPTSWPSIDAGPTSPRSVGWEPPALPGHRVRHRGHQPGEGVLAREHGVDQGSDLVDHNAHLVPGSESEVHLWDQSRSG